VAAIYKTDVQSNYEYETTSQEIKFVKYFGIWLIKANTYLAYSLLLAITQY